MARERSDKDDTEMQYQERKGKLREKKKKMDPGKKGNLCEGLRSWIPQRLPYAE